MSSSPHELAERQHGVVAKRQLRTAGLSFASIRSLAHSRQWEEMSSEVLRRVGSPPSDDQSTMAGILDCGSTAVLSHRSAAAWWGLTGFDLLPATVTRTASSRRSSDLATVHRVRVLPPKWVTTLRGGPIVRPEMLALQLYAVCNAKRAERAVERLWSMRLLSGPSIGVFLDDVGARGRNGTAGLRRYLEVRGPNYVPSASSLESRAGQILGDAGIAVRQQVDAGSEVWVGRVDFCHVEQPLVIEVQSEMYHGALIDQQADEHRLARLRAAGFEVVEVTDEQVWNRPWEVVAAVRAGLTRLSCRSRGSDALS